MKHKIRFAIIFIILVWSVVLAFDIVVASLVSLGPRDFNGNPNSVATNVIGGLWLAGSLAQLYVAILLIKHRTRRLLILAVCTTIASLLAVALTLLH